MPMSKPSSAGSAASDDTNNASGSINNNNNLEQSRPSIQLDSPAAIIDQALSPKDQEDFFQAFWHYFVNTSSPIPLTITVKELGYIFRAFGQKMPDKELRQLMDKHGMRIGGNFNSTMNSISSLDHHLHPQLQQQQQQQHQQQQQQQQHRAIIKKQTSFITFSENQPAGSGDSHQQRHTSSNSKFPHPPPPHQSSTGHSRQNSRPATVTGGGGATNQSNNNTALNTPSTASQTCLNWNQFLLLMAQKLKSDDSEGALGDAFDVFDVKKKGYILSKELRQFMTMLGESRLSEDEVEKMIREADVDGDGTIDKDEFIQMLQK